MLKSSNSSFWLDNDFFNDDQYDMLGEDIVAKPKGKDPMKLAGYRRAIGNFVRIVTGEAIPVKFNTSGDSYTDGKTVTISASLKDKDFDPAVGLALHEGSHIKLTDFETLKGLHDWINNHDSYMISLAEKHGAKDSCLENFDRWWSSEYVMTKMKTLINIIEDRRIDAWVYKNAPGYKGYYQALYEKYFNAKIIDKGLKSDEYTNYDWDSFIFRICNLTNPNRRLDVLELRTIWNMIDLKNIARLKNTNEVRDLAFEVFKFIEDQIPSLELDKEEEKEKGNGPGEGGQGEDEENECSGSGEPKTPEGDAESDDGSKAEGEEAKKGDGRNLGGGNEAPKGLDELSDRQKYQLKKAIEKQEKFQNEEVKKTGISKKMQRQMTALENSGTEMKEVQYESQNYWESEGSVRKENVAVIHNFTKDLVNNVECGMWQRDGGYWSNITTQRENVNEGIRRGIVLGKKLKVRSEQRDTKFSRLRSGKIDKRMIANAGFGAEAIFEKIESFAYNPGIIHISIDNSGSMNGMRFNNAVKTAVAIAKASSMIDNMDCVISFRAGSDFAGNECPVMLIAYDSRKHGMNQIKTLLPYVCISGVTPEGLCFDAIMKEIVSSSRGKDAYFVNMSDGMPYYNNYCGDTARKHTREQVKKMTREGIKVISYFITGSNGISDGERAAFDAMYGKEAQYINTSKISEVAKSMNKKFLEVA